MEQRNKERKELGGKKEGRKEYKRGSMIFLNIKIPTWMLHDNYKIIIGEQGFHCVFACLVKQSKIQKQRATTKCKVA